MNDADHELLRRMLAREKKRKKQASAVANHLLSLASAGATLHERATRAAEEVLALFRDDDDPLPEDPAP